jgi:hypothetical protein
MTPPEISNALRALKAYADPGRTPDVAFRMFYLLKDLRHLADSKSIDWTDLIRRVNVSFNLEKTRGSG